jgi:hypothetical protein
MAKCKDKGALSTPPRRVRLSRVKQRCATGKTGRTCIAEAEARAGGTGQSNGVGDQVVGRRIVMAVPLERE